MASTFPFPFDAGGGGGSEGNEEDMCASGGGGGHPYITSSNCDVCQKILKSLNDVRTLPCLHNFCLNCMPTQGSVCPLCVPLFTSSSDVSRTYGTPHFSTSSYLPASGAHRHLTDPLAINTSTSFLLGNLLETAVLRQETATAIPPTQETLKGGLFSPIGSLATSSELLPHTVSSSLIKSQPESSEYQQRMCQSCTEGVPAVSRCENCRELLCQNCVQAHYRVRMTREHRIVPLISQPSTLVSETTCSLHEEPLVVWCDMCKRSLCYRCLPDHMGRGHSLQYIKGNGAGLVVDQLLKEMRQSQRNMEEAAEAVDRMGERLEARVLSVSNEVRAVLHHHISALEERKGSSTNYLTPVVKLLKLFMSGLAQTDMNHFRSVLNICSRFSNCVTYFLDDPKERSSATSGYRACGQNANSGSSAKRTLGGNQLAQVFSGQMHERQGVFGDRHWNQQNSGYNVERAETLPVAPGDRPHQFYSTRTGLDVGY